MLLLWCAAAAARQTHKRAVTRCVQQGMKRVALFTDTGLRSLPCVTDAVAALRAAKIEVTVFDEVEVEPTDRSFKHAARFARREREREGARHGTHGSEPLSRCSEGKFDGFVSVGGGSVLDTAKAANLFSVYPLADFMKYINAPVGGGQVTARRAHRAFKH
jgi:hydroxyacid-oxoacid transhydrogenase